MGRTHKSCLRPHGLNGALSLWKYEGVVRKSIIALKYLFAADIASELANACVGEIKKGYLGIKNPILVPIPLHTKRQRWRGFNQSEAVGRLVAKQMGWGFESRLLVRKLDKKPQMRLKRHERVQNIRGNFAVIRPRDERERILRGRLFEKTIILFDDVWTTGSTIKEACKVLKKNGAKEVWGMAIAS